MGYTIDELKKMHGDPVGMPAGASAAPAKTSGFTLEELQAKHGAIPGTPDTTARPSGFFGGLQVEGNPLLAPGQANANEGRGTAVGNFLGGLSGQEAGQGTLAGNAFRGIENLGYGAAKALGRLPLHLAQFVYGSGVDSVGLERGNNALNTESPTGQLVNEQARGNNFLQKAGATGTDIATLFTPGGPVSKVGMGAEKIAQSIPALADIARGTGFAGKAARFAPKIAGSLAESAVSTPALTGHGMNGDDALLSVVAPFIAPTIKAISPFKKANIYTAEGRALRSSQEADALAKALAADDPFAVGKFKQEAEDFAKSMRDAFKKSPNIVPNRILNAAETKIANVERRAAGQAAAAGEDYVPGETDVFQQIFNNGKIDGLNPSTGRAVTTAAQGRQTDLIRQNADLLSTQFASSNHLMNSGDLATGFLDDIKGQKITSTGGKIGAEIAKEERIANEIIESQPELQAGAKANPGKLYSISKGLRDAAYKADAIGGDGKPIDSMRADVYRRLAAKIDNELFNTVPDIDTKAANQLRKNQALAYSARSVLQALERVKVAGGGLAKFLGGAFGAAVGYTHGGFFGGAAGHALGEKVVEAATNAYGNRQLASDVIREFATVASKKEMKELAEIVGKDVAKNASERVRKAAELAKSDRIREFMDKVTFKGQKQLRAPSGVPEGIRNYSQNNVPIPLPGPGTIEAPAQSIRQYLRPDTSIPLLPPGSPSSIRTFGRNPVPIELPASNRVRPTSRELETGTAEVKGAKMRNPNDRRKTIKDYLNK